MEKNIYQRMHAVMEKVSYVQKEDKKVNNQYTFVSHDAVTAKIRPTLIEQGILPLVTIMNHKQDGNRTEVDILVEFINIDKPEERISVNSFGYGIDPQDKGPGKAVSYAFKYALLKTFCLETGDDPEKDNIDHLPETLGANQAQIKLIKSLVNTINPSQNTLSLPEFKWLAWTYAACSMDNGKNLAKLSSEKAAELISKLDNYLKELNEFQLALQNEAAQNQENQ